MDSRAENSRGASATIDYTDIRGRNRRNMIRRELPTDNAGRALRPYRTILEEGSPFRGLSPAHRASLRFGHSDGHGLSLKCYSMKAVLPGDRMASQFSGVRSIRAPAPSWGLLRFKGGV
jgi:hypothetical protein